MKVYYPFRLLYLVLVFLLSQPCVQLSPTGPILLLPNTGSSPSNFIFPFQLDHTLPIGGYLLIMMPVFTLTIIPSSCTMIIPNQPIQTCTNLATPNTHLTINQTSINNININILPLQTIVIQFNTALLPSLSYSLQIVLQHSLPNLGAISPSFQLYAFTANGILIEENWLFGSVYIASRLATPLTVSSVNLMTHCLPGTLVNSLVLQFIIGMGCPTDTSRVMIIINGGFTFTASTSVTSLSVSSTAPAISGLPTILYNTMIITFAESFVVNRQFKLAISSILAPKTITTGSISVYTLPSNSITPLQLLQLSIPLSTTNYITPLTISTAQNILPTTPIQFYTSTLQYLIISLTLPCTMQINYVLQLTFTTLYVQAGTIYASVSSGESKGLVWYRVMSEQVVVIGGFTRLNSGTVIKVYMRAWIGDVVGFGVVAAVDLLANINTPIVQGSATVTVSAVNDMFVSGVVGNDNVVGQLTMQYVGDSFIRFVINPPFTTTYGSSIKLYTSKTLRPSSLFNPTSSCTLNGTIQSCSITTYPSYTLITISSSLITNIYPQSQATTVQINNILLTGISSWSAASFQLYFQMTVSQVPGVAKRKMMVGVMVLPQRNILAGVGSYFVNGIGDQTGMFCNVLRIVSSVVADWMYGVLASQKRVISVYAYQGWTNSMIILNDGDNYPCLSSLSGTKCTYYKGSIQNSTTDFVLTWDRVDIVLPGTQTTTKFSVSLPTILTPLVASLFQILIGSKSTLTNAINYKQCEPAPVLGSQTYIVPTSFTPTFNPISSSTMLNIYGNAGSYMSTAVLQIQPLTAYLANSYSACLLIVSTWAFFDTRTNLSPISIASTNPKLLSNQQSILTIQYSQSSFLTIIPLTTPTPLNTLFTIQFNNIKLPYSLDLPNYSIMLIDNNGIVNSYNIFTNTHQNLFDTGPLSSNFSCMDTQQGIINTYCEIQFIPQQEIDIKGQLMLKMFGMNVASNRCQMIRMTNIVIPIRSCVANINQDVFIVQLDNVVRLPALVNYTLTVYGISLASNTLYSYSNFSIMDASGNSAIENTTMILIPTNQIDFPIIINQVSFGKDNPLVHNTMQVYFTLPRELYKDQQLSLVMNNLFCNLNSVASKLNIRVLDGNGNVLPALWMFRMVNSQIVFEGLDGVLQAGEYSIEIYGMENPAIVDQSLIQIVYLRSYDSVFAKKSIQSSTATLPTLSTSISSIISLSTQFNTQTLQQPLSFIIINQHNPIDTNSVWLINFPRYYPQDVWNYPYLAYCMINTLPIDCTIDSLTPYQIVVSNSPLLVPIGLAYKITVLGVPCPRAVYVTTMSTQTFFFAMSTNINAKQYTDYIFVEPSANIISPLTMSTYGLIILTKVMFSTVQIHQNSYFKLTMVCSNNIVPLQWIFITFPAAFDCFYGVMVQLQTRIGILSELAVTTQVINHRIGYQMKILTITAGTSFDIIISALANPSQPIAVDMNAIVLWVADSTRVMTTACSTQLTNQLPIITFITGTNFLILNNMLTIYITLGTYSTPITVTAADGTLFQSNINLTLVNPALSFNPNPLYLYVDTSSSSFSIGASQYLIPTTYMFKMVKKESSVVSQYGVYNWYVVKVRNGVVRVDIPNSVKVPIGGCSLPVKLELTNAPFQEVRLSWSFATVADGLLRVNQQFSTTTMVFTQNITSQWLSFCAGTTVQLGSTYIVSALLQGPNAPSYVLNNPNLTITIISNTTTTTPPIQNILITSTLKNTATLTLSTNINGILYSQLMVMPLLNPYPAPQPISSQYISLQTNILANINILAQSSDYMRQIYVGDRDHRIDFTTLSMGNNNIVLKNLLIEREYQWCSYFQNQHNYLTQQQCINFTTGKWGTISKAIISFHTQITMTQLNQLLCFFVLASNSTVDQIVSFDGYSCAAGYQAMNLDYLFTGITVSEELMSTYIYHFSDVAKLNDPSGINFKSLFTTNGLSASALAKGQATFSVNFINSSSLDGVIDPIDALSARSNMFRPNFTYTLESYNANQSSFKLTNLSSDAPTIVYMVLLLSKVLIYDQITGTSEVYFTMITPPKPEQVANCQDGDGNRAVMCVRWSFKKGEKKNYTVQGLVADAVYEMYIAVANEYPKRPVFFGNVVKRLVKTVVKESRIRVLVLVLWLCLLATV